MKRIFIGIFCLFVAIPCHAIEYSYGKASITDEYSLNSNVYQRGVNKGLTFFKDFDGTLDVKDCLGNGTATFTASRGASNPATYIDDNGVIQVTTTSNEPRFNRKIYTSSGLIDAQGLLIEAAGTNLIIRTDGTSSAAGLWTGWTASETGAGTITPSLVDASDLSGISGANAQRFIYEPNVGDVNKIAQITSTNTGAGTVAQNEVITVSAWIRSQTGNSGVTVKLEWNERDGGGGLLTSHLSDDLASSIDDSWRRFSFTATATEAGCSRISVKVDAAAIDGGDTVDVEVYGIQAEKGPYATSWIPTTITKLTRNAEVLTYPTTGNRTAAQETIVIKATPEWDGTDLSASTYLSDTATKLRSIYGNTSDFIQFQPNATDTAGATASSTTKPTEGTSFVFAGVCKSTGDPNTNAYYDGTSQATDNTDFTANAWGSIFTVGSKNDGTLQSNCIIQKVAIFNRALSAAEVKAVSDEL